MGRGAFRKHSEVINSRLLPVTEKNGIQPICTSSANLLYLGSS